MKKSKRASISGRKGKNVRTFLPWMYSWQLEEGVWSTKHGKIDHWLSDSWMKFYQEASVLELQH
jgi:hypothetical protein